MTAFSNLPSAPPSVDGGEEVLVKQTGHVPFGRRPLSTLLPFVLGASPEARRGFYGATPTVQPAAGAQAAVVNASGGIANPVTGVSADTARQTVTLPLQLADIAAGDFKITLPFDFMVLSAQFRTAKPASTASKSATLTVSVNGAVVTGGAMALTSANQNVIGGSLAATAMTAGHVGSAWQTIGVTASGVTPFLEGSGYVEFVVLNRSLAAAVSTQVAQGNAIRAALVALGLIKGSA